MMREFYRRHVFPRLCDAILGRPFLDRYRRDLLAGAHGAVLEIGFGTGLNLPFYPEDVRRIMTVDPNPGMSRLARRRLERTGKAVEQHVLSGEALPFADGTFDTIVSTFTLCSIDQVEKALQEVCRVLRPGGWFLFLEHGLSPDPGVQKWQCRLNWLEQRLADGCRLDRNIRQLVATAPFRAVECAEGYVEKTPRTHGYLYRGAATR